MMFKKKTLVSAILVALSLSACGGGGSGGGGGGGLAAAPSGGDNGGSGGGIGATDYYFPNAAQNLTARQTRPRRIASIVVCPDANAEFE